MLEILLAILAGLLAGTITGLIPGIHVNLIATLLLSITPFLLSFLSPITVVIFLFSLALTHTFLDAIPSIFLGAPDPALALAVLPGHKYLLDGKGKEAVYLTLYGSLGTLILSILLFPLFLLILPLIYTYLKSVIGYLLIIFILFFILKERTIKAIILAGIFFGLSGILGFAAFRGITNPFLPLLSGLFGISTLIISLSEQTELPIQEDPNMYEFPGTIAKSTSAAVVSGGITSFFPGIGAAQAALLARYLIGTYTPASYLIAIGGTNTANFVLSLATFTMLNKARNGVVVAIQNIIQQLTTNHLFLLAAVALLVGGLAALIAFLFTDLFSNLLENIPYTKLCIIIITLITILTIILSGWKGLVLLLTATALGIAAPLFNIPRHHLMGCLLLPTILFLITTF